MATEHGSPIYRGHRPLADASLVAMVRRSGAAILGKTATTQFASLDPAATRNPHDLEPYARRLIVRIGGGRGGRFDRGCLRLADRRLGDTAGLLLCGVAGYKPSFRLLPDGRHEDVFLVARHRRPVRRLGAGRRALSPPW